MPMQNKVISTYVGPIVYRLLGVNLVLNDGILLLSMLSGFVHLLHWNSSVVQSVKSLSL